MTDPLSVTGSVVGIISLGITVTQGLVSFYTAARDQKSDTTYIATKLNRLLDQLKLLDRQLTDRKFRPDERDLLNNIERSIRDCEECILELKAENERFKDRRTHNIAAAARTAARRLEYPFRRSTLLKLDEDVDETLFHLNFAPQALDNKSIAKIQDDIEATKSLLERVRNDQITSAIRVWLKAPDPSVEYSSNCKKRHSETGLWLVKGSSFSSWLEKPNSFLWLYGFTGCGKSVLCSTAIQDAFRHRRSNPRIGLAFFFFVFNDESKQDVSAMLRSLILQLSDQLKEGSHCPLSQLHDRYCNSTPPDHVLISYLHELVRMFDNVYILLDALDESPQGERREDVLQALIDLRSWSVPGLHLLVTSRDKIDIHDVLCNELGALNGEMLSMKNEYVDRDIAAFVSQHLRRNRKLQKWKDYHGRIESAFTESANGVFRWVECQFKELSQCPKSKDQLEKLLNSLPASLDETYERMLLNIAPASKEYAQRILTLLCYAKRPLTVPELIDAIAVELGDLPWFNPDRRLETVDEIHKVCPGFIEVDEHDLIFERLPEPATVRIAHFSVQEYLESDRILKRKAAEFSVRKREAHTEIACICITYLLEPRLSTSMHQLKEYPLALYAAKTWHEHLRDGNQSEHRVQHQILWLFQDAGKFNNWVSIWDIDYSPYIPTTKKASPVYYAAFLGLDLILSKIIDGTVASSSGPCQREVSSIINAQGGFYGTALQAAAEEGLYAAATRGHESIVQLLLEKGANVNAQRGKHGTALYTAAERGRVAIVTLLIENGADINAQGGFYGNALSAAASGAHTATVKLLIEKGANVNAHSRKYGTALYAAAAEGHKATVKLLIERGADINAQSENYGSALYAAAIRGHEAIVQLLLEKGANVSARGERFHEMALQAATHRGYITIGKLLLEKSADVSA